MVASGAVFWASRRLMPTAAILPSMSDPQYTRFLQWETGDLANQFSDALVALVRALHPEAFEEEKSMSSERADA